MADFLSGSQPIAFAVAGREDERYALVGRILKRFNYRFLSRQDKGVVIRFLMKLSGYSRQQLKTGHLQRRQKTENGFARRYTLTSQGNRI